MATTEELRQILKEDQNGQNLYEHLTQTLMRILIERPKNAYEAFELISAEVKSSPLSPDLSVGRPLPPSAEQLNLQLEWARKCSALLKVPDEPPEESGVKLQDLLDDAHLLEWAGISFGRGELYRIFLSLKKLSESLPGEVERVRLFGRVSTRGLPYFVVEGLSPEDEEGVDERLQEGRGGANKYAYWVTQNTEGGQWVKLPNVTMDQVVKVRQIRRLLTGDLDAAVPSYPPFPGKERHLLRAMIACIAGETSVSPDGHFEVDGDAEPPVAKPAEAEQLNERFPKPAQELKDSEAWRHHEIALNAIGRALPLPAVEDENAPAEEPVEVTAPLEALKPELWALRLGPGGAGANPNSVAVARSLRWPGAVAVAAGRKFVNIYVGNGLSANLTGAKYSPPLPPALQREWVWLGAAEAPAEGEPAPDGPTQTLTEHVDTKVDPTPPAPEGEGEEE